MEKACSTCGYRISTPVAEDRGLISKKEKDMSMITCRTDYCYFFNSIVARTRTCTDWVSYEELNYDTNPPG